MKNKIKNILLVMMIIGFQNNYMQASEELMEAIKSQQVETVKSLLQNGGLDINARDSLGYTPLVHAVGVSNYDIVAALLEAGADANVKMSEYVGEKEKPLLFFALNINNGDISNNIIDELIHAGANVNAENEEGETPLFLAVERGDKNLVQKLVEAGADIHAEDKEGQTALDIANQEKNRSIARYLMSKGAIALHY